MLLSNSYCQSDVCVR